jgi:uncharacterized membrane protein YdjX (TVP38/TMEM64 family)
MVESNKSDIMKVVGLIIFIMVGAFLSYHYELHNRFSFEYIKDFIASMGVWAPVIYMFLYSVTSIIFFPAWLLSTASGAIWGVWLGTVYTVVGATLSATVPFMLARYLGRSFVMKRMQGSKIDICDKFISKNGFTSVFIMRLIPLFPWDMVNYASGICGVRFREYFLATAIGIIPGSFTYNLIGSAIGQPRDNMKIALVFAVVIVMTAGIAIAKRKLGQVRH